VVPVTATRYALAQLKLSTKIPWYPWYVKNQVSAFENCSSSPIFITNYNLVAIAYVWYCSTAISYLDRLYNSTTMSLQWDIFTHK